MTTSFTFETASPTPASVIAATDGVFAHKLDHAVEAASLLITFFQQPRNNAIMTAVGDKVQAIEDALYDFVTKFDVDTATGHQLDLLGAQVGEYRGDRLDFEYRGLIKARALVNSSEGKLEELYGILFAARSELMFSARELYPASVLFTWSPTVDGVRARDLMDLMQQAKPAGVNVQAVVDSGSFMWGTEASAGGASVRCFSTVSSTQGDTLEEVY